MSLRNEIIQGLKSELNSQGFLLSPDFTIKMFLISYSEKIIESKENSHIEFIKIKNDVIQSFINHIESYKSFLKSQNHNHEIQKMNENIFIALDYNRQENDYLKNDVLIEIIDSFKSEINTRISDNKQKTGCYVATMVYGDYDHPQVLELRKFRDDFLSKTKLGRNFIKLYYRYSPDLVERLKNKQGINLIIRRGLDQFIKTIRK
ncbi:CFI-box-CTERM domain-containing protein [Flavimarina sp. Hel_I_48]|uniref:CFI-box-CTERM domain-containing protein n=1 Tax=Flavimarina sp. Hel_I_48 TaxID=1392488 RepID=UPI0004DEF8D7|nr:CFI-box-CTERM domain-containing protein [Flavimarina sp. Hel_I_48]